MLLCEDRLAGISLVDLMDRRPWVYGTMGGVVFLEWRRGFSLIW